MCTTNMVIHFQDELESEYEELLPFRRVLWWCLRDGVRDGDLCLDEDFLLFLDLCDRELLGLSWLLWQTNDFERNRGRERKRMKERKRQRTKKSRDRLRTIETVLVLVAFTNGHRLNRRYIAYIALDMVIDGKIRVPSVRAFLLFMFLVKFLSICVTSTSAWTSRSRSRPFASQVCAL